MPKYIDENVAQAIANDIQKNRVLLGAFDTVDTSNANYNLITRRTWYYKFNGNETWSLSGSNFWYCDINGIRDGSQVKLSNGVVARVYTDNQIRVYLVDNPNITVSTNMNVEFAFGTLLQHQTSTSYTEKVIKGVPILNLDQNGANWLRSEWEKGLQLWDEQWEVGGLVYGTLNSKNFIPVKPNTNYTIYIGADGTMGKDIYFYDSSKTQISIVGTNTFTTPSNCYYIKFRLGQPYGTTYLNDIMLVEGDHPYPYQPYNGAIVHEKEIENIAKTNVNNEFSSGQTITESGSIFPLTVISGNIDTPLRIRSNNNNNCDFRFEGVSGNVLSFLSAHNDGRLYDYYSNAYHKLLNEDDIAELKSLVYDNQYPAVATIKNNTYFAIPNSINGDKLIHSVGMDMTNIEGMSVVVNQWCEGLNSTYWGIYQPDYASVSFSNGVANVSITNTTTSYYYYALMTGFANYTGGKNTINGHKYLIMFDVNSSRVGWVGFDEFGGYHNFSVIPNQWTSCKYIWTESSTNGHTDILIEPKDSVQVGDTFAYKNVHIVDLTQWFGSNDNIPSDLLSNPSLFTTKYWKGSLDYDTGHVESAKPKAVISNPFNILDENFILGGIGTDGVVYPYSTTGYYDDYIIPNNFIDVAPNNDYYIKKPSNDLFYCIYDKDKNPIGNRVQLTNSGTVSIPANGRYLMIMVYGTTYNNDVCINLNSSMNGTYLPHIAPKRYLINVGTDNSVNGVNTIKDNMGVLNTDRALYKVDLGSLNWEWQNYGVYGHLYASSLPTPYKFKNNDEKANMLCSKYQATSYLDLYNNDVTGISYAFGNGNSVFIKDNNYSNDQSGATALKSALNGVYLYYELATPYTEENPKDAILPTNIEIQKGGSIEIESDLPCDITFEVAVSKVY